MEKDSLIFYKSHYKNISSLSDEKLGKLIRAIFEKQLGNEVVLDKDLEIPFNFINNQMVVDKKKYEETCRKRSENGKKGGAPRGNKNAKKNNQTSKNKQNKLNDNENDNDNDNDNKKRKNKKEINNYSDEIEQIINHLNKVVGTKYKNSSKDTRNKIIARLKEGYNLNDFIVVIDKKFKEWGNNEKMKMYLRPITLFGTKFESYLNQREVEPKKGKEIKWEN